MPDVVIIGGGPNGLAAGIMLQQAGLCVEIFEARAKIGGGLNTEEVTEPGCWHDTCAAVFPLAIDSPWFKQLPLASFGLEWVHPEFPLAHPLESGDAAVLEQDLFKTAEALDGDSARYKRLFAPIVQNWEQISQIVLDPVSIPKSIPLALAFARLGLKSLSSLVRNFTTPKAKALLAGLAAHSFLPLDARPSAAFALILGASAHRQGWPVVRGGAKNLAAALEGYFVSLGGKVHVDQQVKDISKLPSFKVLMFAVGPKQVIELGKNYLPRGYLRRLKRFEYGPGVFKLDYLLAKPAPFLSSRCAKAGTVHIGGTFEEIGHSEKEVAQGKHPEKPFVLFAEPTRIDPSRCESGLHTAWAYCHVPHGSKVDMTQAIENQIERFAPGFSKNVLIRHTMTAHEFERRNPNYVGGDINGGYACLSQAILRPVWSLNPYRLPVKGWYMCGASTPPGGGVHGMCGYNAAKRVLAVEFR